MLSSSTDWVWVLGMGQRGARATEANNAHGKLNGKRKSHANGKSLGVPKEGALARLETYEETAEMSEEAPEIGEAGEAGEAAIRSEQTTQRQQGKQKHQGKESYSMSRPELYINREIAAVAFIRRVLEEAQSYRHPLLERVKFISFVSNQVDEFLMVRLAGLKDQLAAQVNDAGPDGLLAGQQIALLRPLVLDILRDQLNVFTTDIKPRLALAGIHLLDYSQLSPTQREAAARFFREAVFPVLTPLGVDRAHPFPMISSRSLNLAVILRDPLVGETFSFARLKAPPTLPRLVPVPFELSRRAEQEKARRERQAEALPESSLVEPIRPPAEVAFVWLEQLIAAHLDLLFPGMEIVASYPFRVLRDADFEIQADEAGDLLDTIEQGLQQRRFGSVVTLIVERETPHYVRKLLRENLVLREKLVLDEADIFELEGPLDLSSLDQLLSLNRPDLKDNPIVARMPLALQRNANPFQAIHAGDILLHHPYDSFSAVTDFIETAAADPDVLAIKQTLYRVGHNSPVVQALLEACERGKQVAVLVELKARFDEENNIEWARMLEHAGVHVVYGQVDLKTHAKVALVVRREGAKLRRYVHLGTGNYNAATARGYEDYGLLTSRPEIGEDVSMLFNTLTGFARGVSYRKLLVAPTSLRTGLMERIEREIVRHEQTGAGRMIFKTNALVDADFIQALYRASQAGVRIDLLVRGICCLRPGIPGLSENIRVRSLVGRFLEHSRIYYFANGGEPGKEEVLMGSADLMPRNLDHRVEVLFPLEDPRLRAQIIEVALPVYLRDTENTRILAEDGSYQHAKPAPGEEPFDVQMWFARHSLDPVEEESGLAAR